MSEIFHRRVAPVLLMTALAVGAVAVGQQSGGIVKTEYNRFAVPPGPAPDLVLFGTGECIGKIEPCG